MKCELLEINRNPNGDYYFIYSVPEVVNHIKPGSKSRSELLIVGVPKLKLVDFLNKEFPGSSFYLVDTEDFNNELSESHFNG